MQRFLLVLMCKMSLFFITSLAQAADQPTLKVSQVRDVVKNIELATAIGQGGQDQINSLQDLEKIFGSTMSALSVDMNSFSTQELQSIAFGGYTFIANPYNRSASVSLNILKELLPLDFTQMAQAGTNSICLGLFGVDASGKFLSTLSTGVSLNSSTTNGLDHFKLYVFKSDGTLLGSGPQYIPLNKYYSQTQQKFITPVFGNQVVSQQANISNATQNLGCLINGKDVTSKSQISYPYLICIENISGIDTPNRYLTFAELSSLLPSLTTSSAITGFYQNLDSLEIIIGNSAFSFNQNSLNSSTDIAQNGICADISQYIGPLANTGMQLVFAAVDTNGDIITNIGQASVTVAHYLLYIFDQNSNLIKAVYVNPAYSTQASYFQINQAANGITVRINGQTITQGQQYAYPVLINLSYGSDIKIPTVSSIKNQITLKKSETLSDLVYNLSASNGAATLDLSKKSSFGANWLDGINGLLAVGQTILINVTESLYNSTGSQASSGYELIFTAYALDSTSSTTSQIAQQSFALPVKLSGLTIEYQTSLSKTSQTLTVSNLQNSWIAIIPSAAPIPAGQALTYKELQKLSTYGAFKAFLNINNKQPLTPYVVTSYVTTEGTIPGWYNPGTQQYSGSGFGLQLEPAAQTTGNGYFFVEDNLGNTNIFNGNSGVAALNSKSPLLTELENTIIPSGSSTMIFLGFDAQGNYIPDISKTAPAKFGLFIFDGGGNILSSSPVYFSAKDYVGKYPSNPTSPATFILNGLGIHQTKSLIYPFALKVTWKFKGKLPKPKPKPTPTPTPTTIPTSAQIPTSMVISMPLGSSLSQFGCLLSQPELFNAKFMSTINGNLKNIGDSLKVQISTSNNAITATAYVKTQSIATSKSIAGTVKTIQSLLYTISGAVSEMELPVTLISGYQDIWLEFKVVSMYSYLASLTLSALQKYISLNPALVTSNLATATQTLPGWTSSTQGWNLSLVQIGGVGYSFVQAYDVEAWQDKPISIDVNSIENTISCKMQNEGGRMEEACSGQCNMVLFGFDQNNNYMNNILDSKNIPSYFGLFMYDASGRILSGFPKKFDASEYYIPDKYKLLPNAKAPAQFILGGLGQTQNPTLTYPFNLTINWSY